MIIGGSALIVVVLVILILSVQNNPDKHSEKDMVIKLIYTFLIGIFLAVFVGVGIAAFYPGPKFPEQPVALKYCSPETGKVGEFDAETKAQIEKFDKEEKVYLSQNRIYNRNVSIVSLFASIVIVIASLNIFKKMFVIADGMLLGGVLTLLYSVIRGFEAEDSIFRFMVVSVGLFISLTLGYIKFVLPANKKSSR